MTTKDSASARRKPQQQRSLQTVDAVLDAVERVLKRHGVDAVTTNRIAEAAGVSIGSVYQYFPDKRSIFTALHNRHVEEVGTVIEQTVAEHGTSSLEVFVRVLVERLVDVHAADPKLHEIISAEVLEGSQGFERALRATFERVLSSSDHRMLFVLPHLIEALVHGVAQRPPGLSFASAKTEAVRTVLLYVTSCRAVSQ